MKTICSRCIYDSDTPSIVFDNNGVCNYCKMIDDLKIKYGTGTPSGEAKLARIFEQIKKDGRNKRYDCVVGVSGGTDSSFMVAKAVKYGLSPLAVHYDNGWNTDVSVRNLEKVLTKLNVDLHTYVLDYEESNDIFRAFFLSEIFGLDISTDLALAEVLYRAADKHNVKYVLEGHSFLTEGVAPLGTVYFDGALIKDIHQKFGKLEMKTYPLMDFKAFMKWVLVKRIRKIRPLWYLGYTKKEARTFLEKEFGWQYYGGHHLESKVAAYSINVHYPQKFNVDLRKLGLAADVRAGVISRDEALAKCDEPYPVDLELIDYFKKRTGLSDEEYGRIMNSPPKTYREYKSYKKLFERLRPLFYLLAKANLVPMSFYIKYTSRSEM
jgi:N-acetyl sugar amidotransferase